MLCASETTSYFSVTTCPDAGRCCNYWRRNNWKRLSHAGVDTNQPYRFPLALSWESQKPCRYANMAEDLVYIFSLKYSTTKNRLSNIPLHLLLSNSNVIPLTKLSLIPSAAITNWLLGKNMTRLLAIMASKLLWIEIPPCSQSMVLRPAASTSPGSVFEMQDCRPHPDPQCDRCSGGLSRHRNLRSSAFFLFLGKALERTHLSIYS